MTSPAGDAGAQAGANQGTGSQDGSVQPTGGKTAGGQGGSGRGSQQQGAETGRQPAGGDGGTDRYAEYLKDIPAQLHGTVTKAFQQWDGNVTRQQQEVQSQLAAYRPLIDAGADPQQLQVAHEFVAWLQEDPEEAMRQMAQTFEMDPAQVFGLAQAAQQQAPAAAPGQGASGDQGLAAGPGDPQNGDGPPPWFTQWQQSELGPLQEIVQMMAQAQVSQHQTQQSEQEIDALEQLLKSKGVPLEEGSKHLDYVLGQLSMKDEGVPLEEAVSQAVQSWEDLASSFGGQAAGAAMPKLLPGGGGLPSQQIDPATLSQKDRRAMAVQRAMQLKAAGG